MACTSAWAPLWPASKAGWRWTRSSSGSQHGKWIGTTLSRPAHLRFAAGNLSQCSPHKPEEHPMRMEDMILVSIDDHMIEPPDMYKNHVPAKWLKDVPKVVRNDQGV